MPVVSGRRMNSLFKTIQPEAVASATRAVSNAAVVGLRRIDLRLRVKIPVRRA